MGAVILLATFTVGAPAPKDPPPQRGGLHGDWQEERLTVAAEDEPRPAARRVFTFRPDGTAGCRAGAGGKPTAAGTYMTDPAASPAAIDLALAAPGEPTGAPRKGIYKVEGDTLTLCLAPGSSFPRPTAFESPKDSVNLLMVFKRVVKKE